MKIRYSYRTEREALPDAVTLMETTRALHHEFTTNQTEFWKMYEDWLRPMNSLAPGHFVSISNQRNRFPFKEYFDNESPIRLEYTKHGPNYVKITFEVENCLPYKIPSGKTQQLKQKQ